MEGVQFILHNPQYVTEYSWGWSWVGLILLIVTAISVKIILNFTGVPKWMKNTSAAIIVIVGLICSLSSFSEGKTIENYHHSEYVVILHEDVNYKEFFEKYEIVDSDGKFYTIIEKDKIMEENKYGKETYIFE